MKSKYKIGKYDPKRGAYELYCGEEIIGYPKDVKSANKTIKEHEKRLESGYY